MPSERHAMIAGERGFFLEFPDGSLFRVSANEGTSLFVSPVSGAADAVVRKQESMSGAFETAQLHVVNRGVTCCMMAEVRLSGSKVTFADSDAELQKMIAGQMMKNVIPVGAFFEYAKKRHLASALPGEAASLPFYSVPEKKSHAGVQPLRKLAAFAAALVLATTCGFLWLQETVTIANTASLVTSDYRLITSPVTGTVIFVNENGTVAAGEPVFGIEGTSGRPAIVNAPMDLTNFETVVKPGSRIERGKALARISMETATPKLIAYVDLSAALEIAKGAVAKVNFRNDQVAFVRVGREQILTTVDDLDTSNPVMKVEFELENGYQPLVGETARVRFQASTPAYKKMCSISSLSRSLLSGWCAPEGEPT